MKEEERKEQRMGEQKEETRLCSLLPPVFLYAVRETCIKRAFTGKIWVLSCFICCVRGSVITISTDQVCIDSVYVRECSSSPILA